MPIRRRSGLTPQQNECLKAIKLHHSRTGAMPSLAEIALDLSIASKSDVHRLLVQLEERGAIRRLRGRARAITLVARECPHCGGALA